jgi:hypothetical protein
MTDIMYDSPAGGKVKKVVVDAKMIRERLGGEA